MAIIKETFIDFSTLGTPSTGQFYLGFDLDGSLKYKNSSGTVVTPGSGGGGTVSGTPSYIGYFDQDGNLSGDSGFIRGTQSTYIVTSDDFLALYGQGKDIFGSMTGSIIAYISSGESCFVSVGELISRDTETGSTSSVVLSYSSDDGDDSLLTVGYNGVNIGVSRNFYASFLSISTMSSFMGKTMSSGTYSSLSGFYSGPNIISYYGIEGSGIIGSMSDGSVGVNGVLGLEGFGGQLNTPMMGYLSTFDQTVFLVGTQGITINYDNHATSSQASLALGYKSSSSHASIDLGITGKTFSGGISIGYQGISLYYGNTSSYWPQSIGSSGQVLTDDGSGNMYWSSPIVTEKITLTPSQISITYSQTLISAPGPGKYIRVLSIDEILDFQTTPWNLMGAMQVTVGTMSFMSGPYSIQTINGGSKTYAFGNFGAGYDNNGASFENADVNITNNALIMATGDSNLILYITYKIIDV